jgi:hypothetical protein
MTIAAGLERQRPLVASAKAGQNESPASLSAAGAILTAI